MSYPRVNLLRKSEQRYQGAVSRRFITISAVVTPVLLIAVISGIKLIQYSALQNDLKSSREIWTSLEPRLEQYKERSRSLDSSRKVLALFDGWRDSQLLMYALMDDVQELVPLNVQFNRFAVRGKVAPASYKQPDGMNPGFTLSIEGIAEGDRAEEDVWKFHKDLLSNAQLRDAFDTVSLSDMRKLSSAKNVNVRGFKISGESTGGAK